MKKTSLIAFAAAAISASSALAAPGGVYVGLNGGYQMIPGKVKADLFKYSTKSTPDAAIEPSVDLEGAPRGPFVNAAFGYVVSDEFRTALSFQYNFDQKNTYNKERVETNKVNAAPKLKLSQSWNVLANFYYDFLNTSAFTPFIGVGLGYGARTYAVEGIQAKAATTVIGTIGSIDDVALKAGSKATKKAFVFGGTLGVAYKISNQVSLELAYAVQTLPKAETKLPAEVSTNNEHAAKFKAKNLAHNVSAGVRFAF
ncbi:MAG: OMP-b-brl domain-containing protein [Candidatus Midichloria mitochondrii]|nr:outer membrane beta-barrel protein [Candidatus Midichloria mitochondrii]